MKIQRLVLMRHSTARKVREEGYAANINLRTLSTEGVARARRMQKKLCITPDCTLSSIAMRCRQTAEIVGNNPHGIAVDPSLVSPNPNLNDQARQFDTWCKELGDAPLAAYLEKGAGEVIRSIVCQQWTTIEAVFMADFERALVVGHGILTPMLACRVIEHFFPSSTESEYVDELCSPIKQHNFAPCDAVDFRFDSTGHMLSRAIVSVDAAV